jgi:hypothetical protein
MYRFPYPALFFSRAPNKTNPRLTADLKNVEFGGKDWIKLSQLM